MSSLRNFFLATGLVALAQAYSQPTSQTWGALTNPSGSTPVTQGQAYQITWDPTGHTVEGVTVSLVLCKGPSTNCVLQPAAIVEGVSAAARGYTWSVPSDLPLGTASTETGYGMLVIVDGTGEFQYSTQFSVIAGKDSGSSSSGSSATSSVSASYTSTSTEWAGWSKNATTTTVYTKPTPPSGYNTTTKKEYYTTTAKQPYPETTTVQATTAAPVATPSVFPGAASHIVVNGALMVMAGVVGIMAL